MREQAPSNELRLSDERIAKLIELWSDTTNPGSMWSDAVLALHELSSRRASDKLRSAHEPPAEPMGTCCYGGRKSRSDCASCGRWLADSTPPPVPALDAKVGAVLIGCGYLDRMKDLTDEDTADDVVREFLESVRPVLKEHYSRSTKESAP